MQPSSDADQPGIRGRELPEGPTGGRCTSRVFDAYVCIFSLFSRWFSLLALGRACKKSTSYVVICLLFVSFSQAVEYTRQSNSFYLPRPGSVSTDGTVIPTMVVQYPNISPTETTSIDSERRYHTKTWSGAVFAGFIAGSTRQSAASGTQYYQLRCVMTYADRMVGTGSWQFDPESVAGSVELSSSPSSCSYQSWHVKNPNEPNDTARWLTVSTGSPPLSVYSAGHDIFSGYFNWLIQSKILDSTMDTWVFWLDGAQWTPPNYSGQAPSSGPVNVSGGSSSGSNTSPDGTVNNTTTNNTTVNNNSTTTGGDVNNTTNNNDNRTTNNDNRVTNNDNRTTTNTTNNITNNITNNNGSGSTVIQGEGGSGGGSTDITPITDALTQTDGQTHGNAGLSDGSITASQAQGKAAGDEFVRGMSGLLRGESTASLTFDFPWPGGGTRSFSVSSRPEPGSALDVFRLTLRAFLIFAVLTGFYFICVRTMKYY